MFCVFHPVRSSQRKGSMSKKKASEKFSAGMRIRVKAGVAAPEFPDVLCEGWTGQVSELIGKKSDPKYVIEWDESVVEAMPASYVEQCEEKHLFYRMACFSADEIEPLGE